MDRPAAKQVAKEAAKAAAPAAREVAKTARKVEQKDLTGERLAVDLLALAGDSAARERMEAAARALAKPDAARAIVEKVIAIAR